MQQLSTLCQQLTQSIQRSELDFQLFSKIDKFINETHNHISQPDISTFTSNLIKIYDLSNEQILYKINPSKITMNHMALSLKLLTCKMIAKIIECFNKDISAAYDFPIELIKECVEIAILCTRICLNQNELPYHNLKEISQTYTSISQPYTYVRSSISQKLQIQNQLNVMEILKFKIETTVTTQTNTITANDSSNLLQSQLISEFQDKLRILHTYELEPQIKEFIESVIIEIVLKLTKSGNENISPQLIERFNYYLTPENVEKLTAYTELDSFDKIKDFNGTSEFFQLYAQIKQNGFQSIELDFIQKFISKPQNFTDKRIFDVAALLQEPRVLTLWFMIANQQQYKSQSVKNMNIAYKCFLHLIKKFLNNSTSSQTQTQTSAQKYFNLCNQIISSIVSQKRNPRLKTTPQPILHIIKALTQFFIQNCLNLYPESEKLKQLAEDISFLCSKYNCHEISKTIYSVLLYYCLLEKLQCSSQVYERFLKVHNHNQNGKETVTGIKVNINTNGNVNVNANRNIFAMNKNDKIQGSSSHGYNHSNQRKDLFHILKTAYELYRENYLFGQTDQSSLEITNTMLSSLRNQPYLAILFCNTSRLMVYFNISMDEFLKAKEHFLIYYEVLKSRVTEYTSTQRARRQTVQIINHLRSFLSIYDWSEYGYESSVNNGVLGGIQENVKSVTNLKHLLMKEFISNSQLQTSQQNLSKEYASFDQFMVNDADICLIVLHLKFIEQKDSYLSRLIQNYGNFGLQLNEFSKLIKIVNYFIEEIQTTKGQSCLQNNHQGPIDKEMCFIMSAYIFKVCEKFKRFHITKQKIGEAGEKAFVLEVCRFIEILFQKTTTTQCQVKHPKSKDSESSENIILQKSSKLSHLQYHHSNRNPNPNSNSRNQNNFFSSQIVQPLHFAIFQIHCLTDHTDTYKKSLPTFSISTLQLFTTSKFISKDLKLQIMRRLLKQSLLNQTKDKDKDKNPLYSISVSDFKQMILLTEEENEFQLYLQYACTLFGQEGSKMITLLANQNERVRKTLLKEEEMEI